MNISEFSGVARINVLRLTIILAIQILCVRILPHIKISCVLIKIIHVNTQLGVRTPLVVYLFIRLG